MNFSSHNIQAELGYHIFMHGYSGGQLGLTFPINYSIIILENLPAVILININCFLITPFPFNFGCFTLTMMNLGNS